MTTESESRDETARFIGEIESSLETAFERRRDEIRRDLDESIRRQREETDRKLSLLEGEMASDRQTLGEYRRSVSEFQTARDSLQARIRAHLEKSMAFQREIGRLTSLTHDELQNVSRLSQQLSELKQSVTRKTQDLQARLQERYGKLPEAPGAGGLEDSLGPIDEELAKLRKIQEILETAGGIPIPPPSAPAEEAPLSEEDPGLRPRFGDEAEPAAAAAPVPPLVREAAFGDMLNDLLGRERREPVEPAVEPVAAPALEPAPEPEAPVEEVNFQAVFAALERFRKTEATDFNGEFSFYENEGRLILDGESLILAMGHILEDARRLTHKIEETESPKDQFFLKQELINSQEVLRKIVLKAVKKCDRESARLPEFTAAILDLNVLKDILERLNMSNWSDVADFRSFEADAGRLRDAFYKRITPPALYLKSMLKELEG